MPASPARTATTYRVLVLGPFELERDAVRVDTARWQRRTGSLFRLLAVSPDQRRLRDEVLDLLWPESPADAGMGSLRIAAHRLRQALGGGDPLPVLAEGGWIGLNPAYGWEVDLHQFEAWARTGQDPARRPQGIDDLEHALALYRGEPLVEDRYEDWAVPVRDRLQHLWRDTALHLAAAYVAQPTDVGRPGEGGGHDRAVAWLERVLMADPLDEEALRRLLEALYAAGRRADALRRYRQFEQHLAEELGVPPSPQTMALLQQLNVAYPPPEPAEVIVEHPATLPTGAFLGALPEGPIVARDEELERIGLVAALAERGTGRPVLVRGERGAGKTRLAQEAMLRLRDRGFAVATGRCYERHAAADLHPFREALQRLRDAIPPPVRLRTVRQWSQLSHLLPEILEKEPLPDNGEMSHARPTGEAGEQQHLFWAITNLLKAIAAERPVALLIDDLDRADEASIDLLEHLARQTAGHHVFLLATYRDEAVGPEHRLSRIIRDLTHEGLIERVAVRRLSLEATSALVEVALGQMDAPAEFCEFVYRRTRGNPFYIQAMLQAVGGHYCLIRQIGRGGMGRVFEAIDARNGEPAAVKLMFARSEAEPRALARFEQEGAVLAGLDHSHIVRVLDTVLDQHAAAIVMELLEGRSLRTVMREDELDLAQVRDVTHQVLSALACAHEHGIVHRDIKPDNIMVLPGQRVKVTDFGVARLVRPRADLTTIASTGMTAGTPLYMAPEQIEGTRIDGRADLYSLGCVLYELLTGQPPFTGDDPLAVALKQLHEAPRPPRRLNPAIPEEWDALVLAALAKDPAARFPSAAAMAAALPAADSRPILPVPHSAAGDELLSPSLKEVVPAEPFQPPALVARPLSSPLPLAVSPAAAEPPATPARRTLTTRVAAGAAVLAAVILAAGFTIRELGSAPTRAASRRSTPVVVPTESASGSGLGQFEGPTGVAVDARGDVYVVDHSNSRIEEFSPQGSPVAQFGSKGSGPGQLDNPTALAVGPHGNIYVADFGNQRIAVFTPAGNPYRLVAHWARHANGPETFNSVAVDARGNIYATDLFFNRVVEVTLDSTWVTQWGKLGRAPGLFNQPEGIAIDPSGNIYVADSSNNRVEEFSPRHRLLKEWGGLGAAPGRFHKPQGVAVDGRGDIYVADTYNNRVQEITPRGKVRVFGSFGDGRGQFNQPSAVAVDGHGNIYVTDFYNNRIEKFSPAGRPLWGSHGLQPGW